MGPGSEAGATTHCWARYRISPSAVSSGLERIDRVSRGGGTDMRFETVAVDHIDRPFEQAGDVLLEARIFEHGQMRRRIDLDHDVEVAVGPAVAARHRAEYGRPPHAARAGQVRIEGGFRGLRCGSCRTVYHGSGSPGGQLQSQQPQGPMPRFGRNSGCQDRRSCKAELEAEMKATERNLGSIWLPFTVHGTWFLSKNS